MTHESLEVYLSSPGKRHHAFCSNLAPPEYTMQKAFTEAIHLLAASDDIKWHDMAWHAAMW